MSLPASLVRLIITLLCLLSVGFAPRVEIAEHTLLGAQARAFAPMPAQGSHVDDPAPSPTASTAHRRGDVQRHAHRIAGASRLSMAASGLVVATKGADEAADVGTDLAVRPKLKPSRHYLHERKMERQLRTANVFDAYKNPLAVGPTRYDPFGRPSTLFQGRNAQVAVNPQTGEIVTAFPTGSRLRRQLMGRAGGSP